MVLIVPPETTYIFRPRKSPLIFLTSAEIYSMLIEEDNSSLPSELNRPIIGFGTCPLRPHAR